MSFARCLALIVALVSFAGCGAKKTPVTKGEKPLLLTGPELSKVALYYRRFQRHSESLETGMEKWIVGGIFANSTDYEITALTYEFRLLDHGNNIILKRDVTIKNFHDIRDSFEASLLPEGYSQAETTMEFKTGQDELRHYAGYWLEIKSAQGFKKRKDKKEPGYLFIDVARGDTEKVDALLEQDPKLLNLKSKGSGSKAIHIASARGRPQMMKVLVARGAKLDEPNAKGFQPIHVAAITGAWTILPYLIDQGIKPDTPLQGGYTPLEYAVEYGNGKAVEVLLAKGADIDHQDPMGQTALLTAANKGDEAMIKLLLKHGANPNLHNKAGGTALHAVAATNVVGAADALLKAGAKINEPLSPNNKHTPLHNAAEAGAVKMIQFLLSKGADKTIKNSVGYTPKQVAKQYMRPQAEQIL